MSQPSMISDSSTQPESSPTSEQRSTRWFRRGNRADRLIWAVIAVVGVVFLERQNTPRTFYMDDWSVVLYRRSNSLHTWLDPHNGHLILIPVVIYKLLLAIFGMNHFRPYRVVGLIAHLAVATMLYRYVRSRSGPVVAIAVGALFLFLGSGWEVIYQPFTINNMIPAAAGIWAWSMLDRRTRNGDVAATGGLLIGLASGGLGICFLLGAAARLAVGREWRRLLRIVAAPAALYAVWYLTFGESQGSVHNIVRLPRYVVDEAASSFAGLVGRDLLWGRVALGIAIGLSVAPLLVVAKRLTRHEFGAADDEAVSRSISIVAPVVAVVANWVLVGYSRADLGEAASSRYVYVGALFLLLAFADIGRSRSIPVSRSTAGSTWTSGSTWMSTRGAVVVALCAIGVWGNWHELHQGPVGMRDQSAVSRVELRAVEWASATVASNYTADDARLPGVTAGLYLSAVAEFRSAGATDGEVEATAISFGVEVDRVSLAAGRFAPQAANVSAACARPAIPSVPATISSLTVRGGGSISVTAGSAAVEVRLVRYAPNAPADPQAMVAAGQTVTLTMPVDAAPRQTWHVDLRSTSPFAVCGPIAG